MFVLYSYYLFWWLLAGCIGHDGLISSSLFLYIPFMKCFLFLLLFLILGYFSSFSVYNITSSILCSLGLMSGVALVCACLKMLFLLQFQRKGLLVIAILFDSLLPSKIEPLFYAFLAFRVDAHRSDDLLFLTL